MLEGNDLNSLDIFREAKVVVNRQPMKPTDIQADWVEVTQL